MGLHSLIYSHSGHHPCHLLDTNCPGSFPPSLTPPQFVTQLTYTRHLLTQWAPPSPSTGHTLSSLIFLPYLHSGPIPPQIFGPVGLYSLIYLHTGHHPRDLLDTNCPASLPLLLIQWAYTSSFYDTVGIYPLIYSPSEQYPHHLLDTNLQNGPIPPQFIAQWVYTPSFTYTVGTTLAIYWAQIVQTHFLPHLHNGPIPPQFVTQWAYNRHLLGQWAPP